MANFSPTILAKAQLALSKKFQAPENRFKATPVLSMGLGNKGLLPGYEDARKRETRSVEENLLIRSKRSTTTSRTHNHSGNRGDSATLPLTWSIFADKFSISMKQLDDNVFSFEQALMQQFENAMMNILTDIETNVVTYLQSERTEVNAATAGGTFDATNDCFEISSSTQFFQIISSMMRQNNYRGLLDVVVNPLGFIDAEYQKAQGAGNDANLTFQFGDKTIAESIELADANYTNGALALVMPKQSFAILPWIPKQNRQGKGDYNSVLGGYGSMMDPFGLGIEFAVHGYTERADTSASNGNTQDDLMQFELSVDIAKVLAPLSTANETVVFQAAKV